MNSYTGSILSIVGPMFGGKTSRLITERRKYNIAGKRTILIKHCMDTRYGGANGYTVTHDRIREVSYEAKHPTSLFQCGLGIRELRDNFDGVFIDEGQFYEDVDEFCETLANAGLAVFCSALLADYNRKPFPSISRLLALSDNIVFTTAVDRSTGKDAPFTMKRRGSSESGTNSFGENYDIGGEDKYESVSRVSYFTR